MGVYMKRFLIFLVATIVSVCIGMTFYQFAKNDEVIKVNTQTIYINYGDTLSLDDIGFSRKEASKDTKINFNAGGEEVTSIIKYDSLTKKYIPTSKGGSTTIKISTTNRKYKSFNIDVIVGIGSEEFPYYISTEEQLAKVGTDYALDACYELVQDIQLENKHTPIGLIDGKYNEFGGRFDGNYHTISNMTIDGCNYGGLFAILGANSSVTNLNISNATLNGTFINVGAVAGICYGNINKVVVENANITNNYSASNTGAVVGLLQTDSLNNVTAAILRTSAYSDDNHTVSSSGNLGGIAGTVNSAIVHACYTDLNLKNSSGSITGGLIGSLMVDRDTYVRESYSISTIESGKNAGNVIGRIALSNGTKIEDITKELVLVGLYYDNSLNTYAGVGSDTNEIAASSTFAVNGRNTSEMKTKANYVYYVNSSNNIVYWDKVWSLVDGEYPTLTFVSKFEDVVIGGSAQNPSNPENPDITNPDTPNTNVTIISTKQDLITHFQTNNYVIGNYIINSDIDLGGMKWDPVKFIGVFRSSDNQSYTISNFVIDDAGLYVGFFCTLSSAQIKNVNFADVTINKNGSNEAAGVVVGYIRGNAAITNVNVDSAVIEADAKYAGGIAGYAGNAIINITNCQAKSLHIGDNASNVGGIAGYVSENTYVYNCKILTVNSLVATDRVGGISAVNYGKIYNSSFFGTISSVGTASSAGYFGGLCAINYGKVYNSSTFAEIDIANNATADSGIYYFVGGLCGYNIDTFDNCSAYGDKYVANTPTSPVFMAGLTGYNKGILNACLASVGNVGDIKSNLYVAGLSVYNYGGKITGCAFLGNLSGYQVGGLVRTNSNEGIIDSCMAGKSENIRAEFKGVNVAGFVYEIANGTISNCLVNATLTGTSNNGWVASFAGYMPCNKNKFGTISYSIANVRLSGVGEKYLEIVTSGLMKKFRSTGTITNSVISADADVDGVIKANYSKFLWITQKPGSKSNYITATTKEIQSLQTYLNVDTCDFDIASGEGTSKWLYISNTQVPLPRAIAEMFN